MLHSAAYAGHGATLKVSDDLGMTATLDVLQELADGDGPAKSLLALGYAGWGPGQLESEILSNGWLTCEASEELVFNGSNNRKWELALRSIGIDPLSLSATAGHA